MIYYGKTDIGKVRSSNQDSFDLRYFENSCLVAVVCDGMGGVRGGNVASSVAVTAFFDSFDKNSIIDIKNCSAHTPDEIRAALAHAVYDANEAVYQKSCESNELYGMGTTLVACIICGTSMYISNVGDSRLYIDDDKSIKQITQDHSYVQFLIDVGDITPEEARVHPYRNRITRAVGIQPDVECDIFTIDLTKYNKAKILLCSDGLCGQIEDKDMHKIISKKILHQNKLIEAVDSLINSALDAGGPDNITVILIEI